MAKVAVSFPQLAPACVRTRINPIVARNGGWFGGAGTGTRTLVCHVDATVNKLGEEPRWPVIENQALTGLPPEGHGPDTAKTVNVRL